MKAEKVLILMEYTIFSRLFVIKICDVVRKCDRVNLKG